MQIIVCAYGARCSTLKRSTRLISVSYFLQLSWVCWVSWIFCLSTMPVTASLPEEPQSSLFLDLRLVISNKAEFEFCIFNCKQKASLTRLWSFQQPHFFYGHFCHIVVWNVCCLAKTNWSVVFYETWIMMFLLWLLWCHWDIYHTTGIRSTCFDAPHWVPFTSRNTWISSTYFSLSWVQTLTLFQPFMRVVCVLMFTGAYTSRIER